MADLITWCRLMRTGPACAIPCDDCRITSGKFARAGITIDPDRFYDAPPTSEETMTYQPEPAEVRKIASRIITSEIDTIRDLGAMDIGEMCEDEIDALHEASPTTAAADRATDVLIDAVRKDIGAAQITHAWPDAEDTFPVITICGSMRFFERMMEVAREMTAAGRIVLMPFDASLTGIANKTATEHGAMLDAMHRAKIRLSQSVYVVNSGAYIGESTRSEIEYATELGMPVEYDDKQEA